MSQFLEQYFNIIALIITILTSIIFVTFMLLKKRVVEGKDKRLHIRGLITISVYDILQILLLIYVSTNVILRLYSIFLSISIAMLLYIEIIYIYKFFRYKNRNDKLVEA